MYIYLCTFITNNINDPVVRQGSFHTCHLRFKTQFLNLRSWQELWGEKEPPLTKLGRGSNTLTKGCAKSLEAQCGILLAENWKQFG